MAIKVLHIIDSGGLYGAELMLLNLAAEQQALGVDVAIASIGEPGIAEKPVETEAIRRGLVVERFRMRAGPNYRGAWEILRHARRGGFDLLHSHGYKGNILFGLLPRRLRRMPLIATLHGHTSTRRCSKLRLYEYLDTWSLRFMDAVVLVSGTMAARLRLAGRPGRALRIIPNGIPTVLSDAPAPTLDQEIVDYCRGGYCIGAIGRLSQEKGHRFLLDAFASLRASGVDARLVVLGEGPEREALLERIAGHGLEGRVLLPGYREAASNYLPYFDLFVNASLSEGLPLTVLEAMQAAVPIVATAVGGVPELLAGGAAGRLVPPRDAAALAEQIKAAVDQPEQSRALTERAKIMVLRDFSSQTMARRYLDLYTEVLVEVDSSFPGGGK